MPREAQRARRTSRLRGGGRARATPGTSLVTIGGFVVGGVLVVPVHALLFVTGLIFPPRQGFINALMGSMTSAIAVYGLGKALPRDAVRLLAGPPPESRRPAILGLLAATALVPLVHAALQHLIGQPELAPAPTEDRG